MGRSQGSSLHLAHSYLKASGKQPEEVSDLIRSVFSSTVQEALNPLLTFREGVLLLFEGYDEFLEESHKEFQCQFLHQRAWLLWRNKYKQLLKQNVLTSH